MKVLGFAGFRFLGLGFTVFQDKGFEDQGFGVGSVERYWTQYYPEVKRFWTAHGGSLHADEELLAATAVICESGNNCK